VPARSGGLVSNGVVSGFLERILGFSGAALYAIVAALVFVEDAIFVGFVLPGETAAILGGVAASRGNVSLAGMTVIVVAAAILGDLVGYLVGARYGDRLVHTKWVRRHEARVEAGRDLLRRRGGFAVFTGRFVAFFRATMPFLAGVSHMRPRRFIAFNAAGGILWSVGSVLLGFIAGNSYQAVERALGPITAAVIAAIVVAGIVVWVVMRYRRAHESEPR
jgi:membrane protein DedA with SNARE-associated domain